MESGSMNTRKRRRPAVTLLIAFALFAVVMFSLSMLVLSSWTETTSAGSDEAEQAFAAIRARHGTNAPVLSIDPGGGVHVASDLVRSASSELESLHVLSFVPSSMKLVDVEFPYWFVRMKLSDTINLGTITSFIAGDWGNLDLRLTEDDLDALGPALLLDHELQSGARLLLWTE